MRARSQALIGALILWFAYLCAGCSLVNDTDQCDAFLLKAQEAASKQEYEKAQRLLKLAAQEAARSDKPFHTPDVLKEQANVAFAQGKFDDAIAFAHSCLSSYDAMLVRDLQRSARQQIIEDRTRIAVLLGDCLIKEDRKEEALQVLKKAADDLKDIGGDIFQQNIINQRYGVLLKELHQINLENDVDAVSEHYESRRTLLKGQALFQRGDLQGAMQALKIAQKASTSPNEWASYVGATVDLAICQLLTGDSQSAHENAQLAMTKAQSRPVAKVVKAKALAISAVTEPDAEKGNSLIAKAFATDREATFGTLNRFTTSTEPEPKLREKLCMLKWNALSKGPANILRHQTIIELGEVFSAPEKKDTGFRFLEQQVNSAHWLADCERADCLDVEANLLDSRGSRGEAKQKRLQALALRKSATPEGTDLKFVNIARMVEEYQQLGFLKQSTSLALAAHADPEMNHVTSYVPQAELEIALAEDYRNLHELAESLKTYDRALALLKKNDQHAAIRLMKKRNQVARLLGKPAYQFRG
jgi:tetratricopeptide (TPR) repeat protein